MVIGDRLRALPEEKQLLQGDKREGDYAEAEKLIRRTIDLQRRVVGPDHWQTAESIYNLGCLAAVQGRRDQAISLLRDAVDHGFIPHYDVSLIEQDSDLKLLHGLAGPRQGAGCRSSEARLDSVMPWSFS
jgi:hypothetical protein